MEKESFTWFIELDFSGIKNSGEVELPTSSVVTALFSFLKSSHDLPLGTTITLKEQNRIYSFQNLKTVENSPHLWTLII